MEREKIKDPIDIGQLMTNGIQLGRNGKNEEALSIFNQILNLDPSNAQAYYNKGVALSNLGKDEDALRSFDSALNIRPNDKDSWYNMGLILKKMGRFDDSQYCLDKALELENKSNQINGKINDKIKTIIQGFILLFFGIFMVLVFYYLLYPDIDYAIHDIACYDIGGGYESCSSVGFLFGPILIYLVPFAGIGLILFALYCIIFPNRV